MFRRRRFAGGPGADVRDRDIAWLVPSGKLMTQDDWDFAFGKALMVYLNGNAISEPDSRGQKITDDSFILMFNAHYEEIEFTLPPRAFGVRWQLLVDTTEEIGYPIEASIIEAKGTITVPSRATMVLKQIEPPVYDEEDHEVGSSMRRSARRTSVSSAR